MSGRYRPIQRSTTPSQEMADKNVGALMVVDGDNLVGVFSERDYAPKIVLRGKASKETLVKEIMSSEVFWVEPDQIIGRCHGGNDR